MTKELIIVALILLVIYYYQQNKSKPALNSDKDSFPASSETKPNQLQTEITQTANQTLMAFLKTNLNSNSLQELKTKLDGKTLNEILEANEDQEIEVDTLTRTKNSLEADLLAQSNAFQNRLREKDREIKRIKEDLKSEKTRADKTQQNLTSEKQQHKGSIERITKLTEQITKLEKEQQQAKQEHTEQLRKINCLFEPKAKDYQEIDFNGLYALLEKTTQNHE